MFTADQNAPAINAQKIEHHLKHVCNFVFFVVCIMTSYTTLNHSMWLDELQPWALLDASTDINDFLGKLKFEGHPVLWFAIVKLAQLFTDTPSALQIFHLLIALTSLFLIWRYSPFTSAEKIFLLISLPFAFQYAVIARSYAIGILLIISGLIVARNEKVAPYRWLLWGLSAHSTFLIGIIVAGIGMMDLICRPNKILKEKYFILGAAMLGLVAFVMIFPDRDFQPAIPIVPEGIGTIKALNIFVIRIAQAFGWTPEFSSPLAQIKPTMHVIIFAWSGIIILLTAVSINWRITLSFILVIATFMFIHFYRYPLSYYHFMLLQILAVFLIWHLRPQTSQLASAAFLIFLLPSVLTSINVFASSVHIPYSQSLQAAEWIKSKNLDDEFWIAAADFETAPVFTYLRRPVYFPQCDCYGPYIEWSIRRNPAMELNDILSKSKKEMEKRNVDTAYLLLSSRYLWYGTLKTSHLTINQIKTFRGSEMPSEQYSLLKINYSRSDLNQLIQDSIGRY